MNGVGAVVGSTVGEEAYDVPFEVEAAREAGRLRVLDVDDDRVLARTVVPESVVASDDVESDFVRTRDDSGVNAHVPDEGPDPSIGRLRDLERRRPVSEDAGSLDRAGDDTLELDPEPAFAVAPLHVSVTDHGADRRREDAVDRALDADALHLRRITGRADPDGGAAEHDQVRDLGAPDRRHAGLLDALHHGAVQDEVAVVDLHALVGVDHDQVGDRRRSAPQHRDAGLACVPGRTDRPSSRSRRRTRPHLRRGSRRGRRPGTRAR